MSTIRVFNNVSKSIYSKKVKDYMEPPMKLINNYILHLNHEKSYPQIPIGADSEFIKLVRFYVVLPDSGWLIDRNCDFTRPDFTNDRETNDIVCSMISKVFVFETKTEEDGQRYALGAVMPMVYKYVSGFYNLTDFRKKDHIGKSIEMMTTVIEQFDKNSEIFAKISKKDPASIKWDILSKEMNEISSLKSHCSKHELGQKLIRYCKVIQTNITKYYIGFPKY